MSINRSQATECGTKQRHRDKDAALAHLRHLARQGAAANRMQAYRCSHCRTWHIGHRPRPRHNRG